MYKNLKLHVTPRQLKSIAIMPLWIKYDSQVKRRCKFRLLNLCSTLFRVYFREI